MRSYFVTFTLGGENAAFLKNTATSNAAVSDFLDARVGNVCKSSTTELRAGTTGFAAIVSMRDRDVIG